ncbi:hypothetical protein HID58_071816, partial [Brassica napus]
VQVDCHLSEKSQLKRATMADSSAPFLTHLEDDEEETSPPLNFDKIFEQSLSDFNLSQFLQVILVGLALTFDAQQIFITVFTDAYPTWHCVDHTLCTPATTDICKLPRSAWDWDCGFKGKSVISEFDLECSSSFLRSFPTSAFYMGSIVGGVFMAMILDGFLGRKQLLFYTTLAMSLTGISIFFSTSIWTYAFLKFAIGVARSQTGTYAFNLIGERVSTKWRPRATMVPFTLFVLGFMSLSGIAFLVRHASWRFIYLCTSVPAAIHSILIYFFALESPRWLHVQGNNKEAIEVLKRISPGKRGYLETVSSRLRSKETIEQSPSGSIMDCSSEDGLFEELRSSVLVNCLVGGALKVFCFVLTTLGRTNMAFVFELGSFFCARIGFNLTAVYLIEMFPTCVRNFATTMLRQALVIGGACCPIIASVGRNVPSISFAVFGFVVSGLGIFALLLPETKGASLCDTMDEQEQSDQALKTGHVSC